jgi:4-hydroxybenzoyl-CoA thioesterase
MIENTITVAVHWSDADPAGIAFYPRFFAWYDLGSEALFESIGLPWPALFAQYDLSGVPILESGSRFIAPVRFGDVLRLRSVVAWVKSKTFRMEHEITLEGTLCASGFEVRAWVGRPERPGDRLKARPIPREVVGKLIGSV